MAINVDDVRASSNFAKDREAIPRTVHQDSFLKACVYTGIAAS